MITEEYKKISAKQFQKMHTNYPGSFFRGNFSEAPIAIAEWIKILFHSNVKENEIEPFVEFIINENKSTKNIAPKNSEISEIYQYFCKTKEDSRSVFKNDIELAILESYKYLCFRYDRLFKSDGFSKDEHYQLWFNDMVSSKATAKGIRKALEKIKLSSSQYPPNIGQFVTMSIALSFDNDLPMPEEAFNIAISHKDLSNFHPIIAYVRSIIGYQNLIQNAKYKERIFEKEYQETMIKLFNGQLTLSGLVDKDPVPSTPLLNSDTVASELWNILNNRL